MLQLYVRISGAAIFSLSALGAGAREMMRDIEQKSTRPSPFLTIESEFSGGLGFGDPEFVKCLRQESAVPGTGLGASGLQSVARRQLVGSIVVVAMIAVVSALMALQPVHSEVTKVPAHSFKVVRQPALVTPVEQIVAMKRQTANPDQP